MRDVKIDRYAEKYQRRNAWLDKWHIKRGNKAKAAMRKANVPFIPVEAELGVKLNHEGEQYDFGIVSRKKVTDEFVAFMVDQLQAETSTWGDFKHHISGTGTTAEDNNDVQLVTPVGTAREVGTQLEGASVWIYKSVATIAYTATLAITEHAIFNEAYAAAQTDGILMDRSVFTAVNVVDGDSIEFTYQLTCTAEA